MVGGRRPRQARALVSAFAVSCRHLYTGWCADPFASRGTPRQQTVRRYTQPGFGVGYATDIHNLEGE
jgi:hypothetical protein